MMGSFAEKTILVTGASSGIGRAVAERISDEGARCVLVARDIQRLNETAQRSKNTGDHVIVPCDLSEPGSCRELFEELRKQSIVLDGMVHCAGIAKIIPLRALSLENEMEIFRIHYFAFIDLVRQYARKGAANGGSIVGISSINAHTPQKCMTAYAAAKAAVECSCRTLALELIDKGIRINSVVVGGINTEMGDKVRDMLGGMDRSYDNPVQRQLLGLGSPDDVAGAIRFLLSDDSRFITGRELFVDGGLL